MDVGTVRLGLALCDREAILSSPIDAVVRSADVADAISEIVTLVGHHEVIEVYVGDPLSLSGNETVSTQDARSFAIQLSKSLAIPVRLVDERFTTVTAAAKLRDSGLSARQSKSIIDSASAVEILESALSYEKNSGVAPGSLVGDSVGA